MERLKPQNSLTRVRLFGHSSFAALAAASFIAGTGCAFAQTDVIVVTAQKREQSINTVPMSVTAASAQQLEQAGIKDVGDLAKITPGLTLGQNNLGVTTLTLRGVGSNDVGIALRPSVTVYLDEAPMTFGIEANGVGLD
ncbi:MAG: TonB-dependent receptor plug domain-containing protein, partial [Marinicaulis sp.]|nr:TonB-dependent receptor plug domain-containing protein [Marinicaulis sp.]